jgi:hypothetical protein
MVFLTLHHTIIDAMVVVQQVADKPGNTKIGSCSEFAAEFLGAVERKTSGYDAVQQVFDHYVPDVSLKLAIRERRKGNHIQTKLCMFRHNPN